MEGKDRSSNRTFSNHHFHSNKIKCESDLISTGKLRKKSANYMHSCEICFKLFMQLRTETGKPARIKIDDFELSLHHTKLSFKIVSLCKLVRLHEFDQSGVARIFNAVLVKEWSLFTSWGVFDFREGHEMKKQVTGRIIIIKSSLLGIGSF